MYFERHARTLHKARCRLGGEAALAALLNVSLHELGRWLDGLADPPVTVVLECVEALLRAEAGASAR